VTNKTIPNLPTGGVMNGSEPFETVMGGVSVRKTAQDIANLAPAGATGATGPSGGVSLPLPFFGASNPPWNGASTTFSSWLYQGSSTATAVADGPLVVQGFGLSGPLPATYISANMRALPSPPYTITVAAAAVFSMSSNLGNSLAVPTFPVMLYDSISDTAYVLSAWSFVGGFTMQKITGASNPSTAVIANINSWYTTTEYFGWFKVQNDGVNIIMSYSAEGILFLQFFEDTIANFGVTFTDFGFGLDLVQISSAVSTLTPDPSTGAPTVALPLWNFTQTSP
jgi:hypothetical protein